MSTLKKTEQLPVLVAKGGEIGFPKWLKKLLSEEDEIDLWLDHPRHVGSVAYFEPYFLNDTDVEKLVLFCKKHKLHFNVVGRSHHYPSATFRVVIRREAALDNYSLSVMYGENGK